MSRLFFSFSSHCFTRQHYLPHPFRLFSITLILLQTVHLIIFLFFLLFLSNYKQIINSSSLTYFYVSALVSVDTYFWMTCDSPSPSLTQAVRDNASCSQLPVDDELYTMQQRTLLHFASSTIVRTHCTQRQSNIHQMK